MFVVRMHNGTSKSKQHAQVFDAFYFLAHPTLRQIRRKPPVR